MGFRLIISLTAGVMLIMAALVSSWQFSKFHDRELRQAHQHLASQEVGIVTEWIGEKLQHLREELSVLVQKENALRLNDAQSSSAQVLSPELKSSSWVGLLLLSDTQDGRGAKIVWSAQKPILQLKDKSSLERMVNEMPRLEASTDEVILTRVQDSTGTAFIAVIMTTKVRQAKGQESPGLLVGLLSKEYFAKVSLLTKTSSENLYVVDAQGHLFVDPEQSSLGGKTNDKNILQIIKTKTLTDVGVFKREDGVESIGAYGKILLSNIFVIVEVPAQISSLTGATIRKQIWYYYLGLALLIAGLVYLFLEIPMGKLKYFRDSLIAMATAQPLTTSKYIGPEDSDVMEALHRLQNLLSQTEKLVAEEAPVGSSASTNSITQNQALQSIGEGVAASLKEPINAILGHAQLARADSESVDSKQHLTVIEREARRSREIVENLLRFVDQTKVECKRYELQDIVLKALAQLRKSINDKGIEVKKNLGASVAVKVECVQLQFAIEQLIANAVESLTEVDNKLIELSIVQKGSKVSLVVKDSGAGVDAEAVNKIFSPFYTTKSVSDHTGLGLTTAKAVVGQMQGELFFVKNPEGGSSFTIELPVASTERLEKIEELAEPEAVSGPGALDTESNSKDLFKMVPLTGTAGDKLPAAPAVDEVTFAGVDKLVGVEANEEPFKPSDGVPQGLEINLVDAEPTEPQRIFLPEATIPNVSLPVEATEPGDNKSYDGVDDFDKVEIRKPKVKVKS